MAQIHVADKANVLFDMYIHVYLDIFKWWIVEYSVELSMWRPEWQLPSDYTKKYKSDNFNVREHPMH